LAGVDADAEISSRVQAARVGVARGGCIHLHLASVLQDGQKSANIRTGSGFLRETLFEMNSSKHWATLSNYQSHELVRRDYQRKHGREANAAHTKEICSPFIQAQHYFRAASLADRTVYPLLLYYGVVSLSRGLTLFLSAGLREAALSASHGLSVRDWQSVFSKNNPDVANLAIRLNSRGTLIELIDATGNRSLLRSNSSAVNVKYIHGRDAGDNDLTFGDLLSRLPDITDQYVRWKERPGSLKIEIKAVNGEAEFVIRKSTSVNRAIANSIFQDTDVKFKEERDDVILYQGPDSLAAAPRLTDRVMGTAFDAGIGDLYVTRRFSNNFDISKIALTFSISYIVGMMARYNPTQWLSIIHNQRNDGAFPTIYSALDFVENMYPRMVLDYLEET
jgi:hypothetical protein